MGKEEGPTGHGKRILRVVSMGMVGWRYGGTGLVERVQSTLGWIDGR